MKYRHEKQVSSRIPHRGWRGVFLWLIGFPGYIIFLLTWLGVLSALGVTLAAWFISPGTNTQQPQAMAHRGGGLVLGPALTIAVSIAVTFALALVYWLSVNYTIRVIDRIAEVLDTSVWNIKFIGLPLGCGLAAIAAMLFRPEIGLNALSIAAVLSAIGLGSFGAEYAYLYNLRNTKKQAR